MSKNKDGIYYHMRNEQVSNGLYHVAYIFNNGEIISTIDELIFADKLTPFKDLVTVNVYPNKIENNLLNFDLKALGKVSLNLIVQDLSGYTLYSEKLTLANDELLNKKITIPSTTTDYNQLRLNLQFIDGSTIQITILK
jgi:hypothetical protein